jgi:hypothetical protein
VVSSWSDGCSSQCVWVAFSSDASTRYHSFDTPRRSCGAGRNKEARPHAHHRAESAQPSLSPAARRCRGRPLAGTEVRSGPDGTGCVTCVGQLDHSNGRFRGNRKRAISRVSTALACAARTPTLCRPVGYRRGLGSAMSRAQLEGATAVTSTGPGPARLGEASRGRALRSAASPADERCEALRVQPTSAAKRCESRPVQNRSGGKPKRAALRAESG